MMDGIGMTDSTTYDLVTMFLKLTMKLSVNNQFNFHLFLTQIYHETSEDIYRKQCTN